MNANHRESVNGYIITLGGTTTGWCSKTQSTVSLSMTEEKYMSFMICAQEVMFQII